MAQLLTHPPARRGAVWDGRLGAAAFMVIRYTEGGTAGSVAWRKALAAFRERPNGQVPHPADHVETEVGARPSSYDVFIGFLRAAARKGRPNGG